MYCKQCKAVHPGVRTGPEELVLYRVMLLNATEKSFFCNPACYELYRKETYAPEKFVQREKRLADVWHLRENWKERSFEVKRALGYAK